MSQPFRPMATETMQTENVVVLCIVVALWICTVVLDIGLVNPLGRSAAYRLRRLSNWLLLGGLMSAFYIGRYNLSIINNASVRSSLDVSKKEYGLALTMGFWSYAVFQIINGHLVDRIGGRKGGVLGAIGSSIVNGVSGLLFFYHQHSLATLIALNIVNNAFQPFGSQSVIKVNSNWYLKAERGLFSGILGVLVASGYFFAIVTGGWVLDAFALEWVFFKPAILLALFGALTFFFVKDEPAPEETRLQQSKPEDDDSDELAEPSEDKNRTATGLVLAVRIVFGSHVFRLLAIAMMCVGFIRESFMSWFTSYLEEEHGVLVGSGQYTITSTGIVIGGMLGSLFGGYVSDQCCSSRRAPVVAIYFLMEAIVLVLLHFTRDRNSVSILLSLFGFVLFGTLTLILGSASADTSGRKLAGISSGILNACQYVFSGIGSFLVGWLVESFGWSYWAYLMLPFAIIGFLSMFAMHRAIDRKLTAQASPPAPTEVQMSSLSR